VGILGGGQLGRMLALACAELGLSSHIYCPDPRSPAFAVAAARTVAPYDDETALAAFADSVDIVTYEFENIPATILRFLAARVTVAPSVESLEISQDRLAEKQLMTDLGIPVPAFAPVNAPADIYSALARTGRPAVLKTRRLGYDGKGQTVIRTGDDPSLAWRTIGEVPAILESFVDFEREISVVLARAADGTMRAWDIGENRHEGGILSETNVPASISPELAADAVAIGERIAEALRHVGVLAVELFVSPTAAEPRLLVNEIAPRVHNSGHWTEAACTASQFEQHIRAICGLPLATCTRHSDCEMENLIGDEVERLPELLRQPETVVQIYGKHETRPGRKMGHFTRLIS
jgi:5-(carboxyamino)imidazole ribonucleotide synthase